MLFKLIDLYSCVTLLNFMIITCHGEFLSLNMTNIQNITHMNMGFSEVTESQDALHPIIHTHNWLAAPTILTSTMTLLTVPDSRQNSDLENNLKFNAKQKYEQPYTNPQTYHNSTYNVHHHSGNNSKRHINTLTSQSQLSTKTNSLSSLQSIKHNNLNLHVYPANIKNDKRTNNLSTKNENLYSQMQMSKHIKSQVKEHQQPFLYFANKKNYSVQAHLHSHSLTNVIKHKNAKSSALSFTNWHYLPKSPNQAEDNIFVPPINENNSKTVTKNLHIKMSNNNETEKNIDIVKHSANKILAKRLNSFKTNETWKMENQLTNVQKQPQKSKFYSFSRNVGIKSVEIESSDEPVLAASVLQEIFTVKQFLRNIFKPLKDIYRNFGDIIWSKYSNNRHSSFTANDEDDDYDLLLNSNEDFSSDNNELQSYTLNPAISAIVESTIASTLKRILPLDVENSLLSLAAIDKVKGHNRHIEKDDSKYSVIKLLSAAALSWLSLQKSYETQNKTVKAPFESLANNYTLKEKHLPILSLEPSSQRMHTSSYFLTAPMTKALSSGRKMKKYKKKIKKILFPLLLAYKLKFMALIPLLIGGLILLVGSTGLAGFFFALFTAVMSLKSDNRSAFIVKSIK